MAEVTQGQLDNLRRELDKKITDGFKDSSDKRTTLFRKIEKVDDKVQENYKDTVDEFKKVSDSVHDVVEPVTGVLATVKSNETALEELKTWKTNQEKEEKSEFKWRRGLIVAFAIQLVLALIIAKYVK